MRLFRSLLAVLCLLSIAQAQEPQFSVKVPFVGPKRWALVIGASNYKEFGELKYSTADALEISKSLVEAYAFPAENVRTLVDGDGKFEPPTSANMLKVLSEILNDRSLDRGDLFVFYFSGHGLGSSKGDYLLPTDATKTDFEKTGVPIKEVIARIVGAGLKNVLIICDACRAGEENPFGAELQALGKKANLAVLLGCAPGRRSYEYPKLGHGIFTYTLAKAMRNEELRDKSSGALWASAVAEEVKKGVASYTERDYGADKQVPATWGEGNTSDVLIGAYVSKAELTQQSITSLLEAGSKMDRAGFAKLLRAWSLTYSEFNLTSETIETLRTLDQIGEATPGDLLLLANTLTAAGRSGEATRVLERLIKAHPRSSASDYAILLLDSSRASPAARRQAARRIFDADPDWASARMLWEYTAVFDPVSPTQVDALARELSTKFGPETRLGLYFLAYGAFLRDDPKAALQLHEKGTAAPGTEPEPDDYLYLLYRIAERYGNAESIDRIIQVGKRNPKRRDRWQTIEFSRAIKTDEVEWTKVIREQLSKASTPYEILDLATMSGNSASMLLPDFRAAAGKHPFAWEAHLARWLCELAAAKWPFPFAIDPLAVKYAPSQVELKKQAFRGIADLMAGEPDERQMIFHRYFLSELAPHFGEIGADWGHWNNIKSFLFDFHQQDAFGAIAKKYIAPVVAAGEGGIQLKETLLLAYLNAGLMGDAASLFAKGGWESVESTDMPLRYAIHLTMLGRVREARKVLAENKPVSQKSLDAMRMGLNLLLDAETDPSAVRTKLATFTPENIVARQLKVLALAKVGRLEDQDSLVMEFMKVAGEYNSIYLDVYGRVLTSFQTILLGMPAPAREIGLEVIPSIALEWGGNPYFTRLYLDEKSSIEDYVGTIRILGTMYPEGHTEGVDGEILLTVGKNGTASGSATWLGERLKLDGRITPTGDFELTTTRNAVGFTLRGKLLKRGRVLGSKKLLEATTLVSWTSPTGKCMEFRGRQRS